MHYEVWTKRFRWHNKTIPSPIYWNGFRKQINFFRFFTSWNINICGCVHFHFNIFMSWPVIHFYSSSNKLCKRCSLSLSRSWLWCALVFCLYAMNSSTPFSYYHHNGGCLFPFFLDLVSMSNSKHLNICAGTSVQLIDLNIYFYEKIFTKWNSFIMKLNSDHHRHLWWIVYMWHRRQLTNKLLERKLPSSFPFDKQFFIVFCLLLLFEISQ